MYTTLRTNPIDRCLSPENITKTPTTDSIISHSKCDIYFVKQDISSSHTARFSFADMMPSGDSFFFFIKWANNPKYNCSENELLKMKLGIHVTVWTI